MNETLKKSIYKTLVYFDLFSYPLTREELYHYLWEYKDELPYIDFFNALEKLEDARIISTGGYYMLKGREGIIAVREKRQWFIKKKMHIAKKAARLYRFIPFVRAMFVCNQLPVGVEEDSDIDVFIVVKNGRIWITRFLVTIITAFRGIRRSNRNVENRICLSFYGVDTALNFSGICIEESPDIYLAYWLQTLLPIYDSGNVYREVQLANNWTDEYVRMQYEYKLNTMWGVSDKWYTRMVKRFFEIAWNGGYGNMVNDMAKQVQQQKMKKNKTSLQHAPDSRVIISDDMLKFHENDRRHLFLSRWQEACLDIA
ncbi:MAG: hypothetical protein HOE80_00325 [Candidatus Magasanikbacteria bacterium]|jgi:hypothetical protein|nr:hypothetical protein [Candidatus Magasanikbacteria bacterium]MBT4071158.1 hypothetical protein [Candidatus Magasanikbacteria bacterium]